MEHPTVVARVQIGRTDGTIIAFSVLVVLVVGIVSVGISGVSAVVVIAASGGVGIQVMTEICLRVLDGLEMPSDLAQAKWFQSSRRMVTSGTVTAMEP